MSTLHPRVTLSIGGVDVCLVPSNETGTFKFVQNSSQEITLDLTSFSGRLVVAPSIGVATPQEEEDEEERGSTAAAVKVTPRLGNQGSSFLSGGNKKRTFPSADTPETLEPHSPLLRDLLQGDEENQEEADFQDCYENSQSTTPAKKLKTDTKETERPKLESSLAVQEEDVDNIEGVPPSQSQTQDTLLAQMDLSQTQGSVMSQTQPSNDDDHVMSDESSALQQGAVVVDRTSHLKNILNGAVSRPASPAVALLHTKPNEEIHATASDTKAMSDVAGTCEAKKNDATANDEQTVIDKPCPTEKLDGGEQGATTTEKPTANESVVSGSVLDKKQSAEATVNVSPDSSAVQINKDATASKVAPSVSIPSPETDLAPKTQRLPSARWGHTITPIHNGYVLVYGGQGWDPKAKRFHAIDDLSLYNLHKKTWHKPFTGDTKPRQWHTSTYLPDRQLLLIYGGEYTTKSGKSRSHKITYVLDTELMVWYAPDICGELPQGRSGHSAAMIGRDLVVFGGSNGSKQLNTTSVLNTDTWYWRQIKIQGSAPKPRSYHSATPVGTNRMVVFGGNDNDQCFATVHVLEKMEDGDVWQWTHPTVTGYAPKPRTGHSATLLHDGKTICIYGGWDPNDDDVENDEDFIWGDVFLLNTETWQWKKLSESFSKRTGHEAILLPHLTDETGEAVLSFGGRLPRDQFTNDMEIIKIR